jgi:hypothetical protein
MDIPRTLGTRTHRYGTILIAALTIGGSFVAANSDFLGLTPAAVTFAGNAVIALAAVVRIATDSGSGT